MRNRWPPPSAVNMFRHLSLTVVSSELKSEDTLLNSTHKTAYAVTNLLNQTGSEYT